LVTYKGVSFAQPHFELPFLGVSEPYCEVLCRNKAPFGHSTSTKICLSISRKPLHFDLTPIRVNPFFKYTSDCAAKFLLCGGWGGPALPSYLKSQEFTAFACAVEGFDLGEDGLAYELILCRHHLCVQRALQALLRLNARSATLNIIIEYLYGCSGHGM
jgi:hypothetical protein